MHKNKLIAFQFEGSLLYIAKASTASNPQLHGRAQVAARDPPLAQRVPAPLQGQRLRGQQHTHGEARAAQARDCLLRVFVEHRRGGGQDCHVVLQLVLRRSRDSLWLRRDSRHTTLAQS